MTLIADATAPVQVRRPSPGPGAKIVKVLTTTDHKTIGLLYLCHVVRLLPGRRRSWR